MILYAIRFLGNLWHFGPGLPHDDAENACMLSHGIDNLQPYEIAMKQYLLGKSESMPDISQDDLGHVGSEARKNPPGTVFRPHDYNDYKSALFRF